MSYQYYNERERTAKGVNFDLTQQLDSTDAGNAVVYPAELPDAAPDRVIGFNEARSCKSPDKFGVHFFLDDYQFERIWHRPDQYVNLLQRFPFVLGPDFSLYTDYPDPLQRWNHYRNQLLAAYYQSQGVRLIPAAGWSDETSYGWCFDGLPERSTLAVSTVGCMVHKQATRSFIQGLQALIDAKHPSTLVVYGKVTPEIESILARAKCRLVQYAHGQALRMGRVQKEEKQHGW